MKYPIIFLDIDGVLNGYNYISDFLIKICKRFGFFKNYDCFAISSYKIKLLYLIIKFTGAKIVISSSWKNLVSKDELKSLFSKYFAKDGFDIIGCTPTDRYRSREYEVLSWLGNNEDIVKSYVILDDEGYEFSLLKNHLVQTSSVNKGEIIKGCSSENTGLHIWHVFKAIRILRRDMRKL